MTQVQPSHRRLPDGLLRVEGTITAMSERPSLLHFFALYRWSRQHGRKVRRVIEGVEVDRGSWPP